jgi:hypothetical protein
MLHPLYALKRDGIQTEYNAQWAHAALQDYLLNYADGETTYLRALRAFSRVLYERALEGTDKRYFLDKTPRYYFIIPDLYRLFPEAKFILLIRNPLAVLYSILQTWVIPVGWPYLETFRDDLLTAPRRLLGGMDLLGRKAIVLHYEELVENPKESISSLCSLLEFPYHDDMLDLSNHEVPKGRMGDVAGINNYSKPTTASLKKWQHLADDPQTRHFAQAYLDALGQEVVENLGYRFDELLEVIGGNRFHASQSIVPWDIIIRAHESWTFRERLTVHKAMAIQRRGLLPETLSFIANNGVRLIRSLLTV